jgi:hypothetical protein
MSAHEETNTAIETVTPPAGDANATPEGAAGADANAEGARDEKGRFRNPVQPRIDELTRKAREAERERDYWRTQAESSRTPEPKAEEAPKPKVEDFDNYNEYVESLTDWKADQKAAKIREDIRNERAAERGNEQAKTVFEKSATEARKALPDFDEVMAGAKSVRISEGVAAALRESDRQAELCYQLVKDPSIADRLSEMTPARAAMEIARMESALEPVSAEPDPEEKQADVPAKPVPPVRKTTSAPAPIKPLGKGASTQADLSKLGMDDYVKRRSEQGAKWARR